MHGEKRRALEAVRAAVAAGGDGVLAEVARALQALPRYTGVYLYALEGATLVLRAHAGRDTEHVRIPVDRGICGLSARTGEAVIVDDVGRDPGYLACNLETRSEIVVPIRGGGRYLAQIDVDSDAPAAFSAEDRAFLEAVAALVAGCFG